MEDDDFRWFLYGILAGLIGITAGLAWLRDWLHR